MSFILGNTLINWQLWDSRREMLSYFESCEGYFLFGENAQQEAGFYGLIVYDDWSGLHKFGIGIISEGHGLSPSFLGLHKTNMLIFGFNNEVVGFNTNTRTTAFNIVLESLFIRLIYISEQNIILLFHEIGVMAIAEDGNQLWEFSKDIITDATIQQNSLILIFMDSEPTKLRVTDGALI